MAFIKNYLYVCVRFKSDLKGKNLLAGEKESCFCLRSVSASRYSFIHYSLFI